MERLTQEADFGLEDWEETLLYVKSDPYGAYDIIDIARHVGEPEFDEILKNVVLRLSSIENILGDDYDLDRLKDIVEADRERRLEINAKAQKCPKCGKFQVYPRIDGKFYYCYHCRSQLTKQEVEQH